MKNRNKKMKEILKNRLVLIFLFIGYSFYVAASAAENGNGTYLMGSKGSAAGVIGQPGWYFQNDTYMYRAKSQSSVLLPIDGEIVANVRVTAMVNLPTFVWVSDQSVAQQKFGLLATFPIGYKSTRANVNLNWQEGPLELVALDDKKLSVGDPVLGAFIGSQIHNWHWQWSSSVNVPIGQYKVGNLSNMGYNHWSWDNSLAVSWFSMSQKWEVTQIVGHTLNSKNRKTDYRSGQEVHWDGLISRYLSNSWQVGVNAYHYQQISADSGLGAVLGAYKGRSSAVGFHVGYATTQGTTVRLKSMHELNVRNRVKGNALLVTLAMPLR